tara:strand:- start:368 stop:556 length:189 start_codon:yes stop_codon:yes gene_type:complete
MVRRFGPRRNGEAVATALAVDRDRPAYRSCSSRSYCTLVEVELVAAPLIIEEVDGLERGLRL